MAAAREAQFDPVVGQPFAVHAVTGPGGPQHVDGALLQDPGALPLLDVVPVPALQYDRFDARPVQKPRQQQPRGPRSDDADRRAHPDAPLRSRLFVQ